MISFLQCNAEWICAIIISLFAILQWHISKKQKNLMLLERRLELKKNFNLFTTKIMETTSYPQKDLEKLSNSFDIIKNLANKAELLFNSKISAKIEKFAISFEEYKTSFEYNYKKNQSMDIKSFESLGTFEKDLSIISAKLDFDKHQILEEMQKIMKKDKV